jgi:hypothetical protein
MSGPDIAICARRGWTHNGHMADVDWDGWLDRLVEEKAALEVADVRAYLIAEISRAMLDSDALRASDADRLAEIAVDSLIESTHKNRIPPA